LSTVHRLDTTEPTLALDKIEGWNDLARQVHIDNVRKGFWPDEGRNFGEIVALMHSEISEAHFGWEDPKRPFDEQCPKYLNAYVEIADCAIRLLDMLGIYDSDLDLLNTDDYRILNNSHGDKRRMITKFRPMASNLKVIDCYLSDALEADRKSNDESRKENLEHAFMTCIALLEEDYQNARAIIDSKLAYNRQRPHKHGKSFG